MQYTMKPRPTVYNGIHFRSRLEATWAAMFDCMGSIDWEYEPSVDFDGWLPDFALKARGIDYPEPGYKIYFCEVKPVYGICPDAAKKIEPIARSRNDGLNGFAFFGLSPFFMSSSHIEMTLMHRWVAPWDWQPHKGVQSTICKKWWGAAKKATRYEPAR